MEEKCQLIENKNIFFGLKMIAVFHTLSSKRKKRDLEVFIVLNC